MSLLDRAAEEELESWADRAEVGGRREREVQLKAAGKQEDSVDRGAVMEVEKVNAVEVVDNGSRPVLQHVRK